MQGLASNKAFVNGSAVMTALSYFGSQNRVTPHSGKAKRTLTRRFLFMIKEVII